MMKTKNKNTKKSILQHYVWGNNEMKMGVNHTASTSVEMESTKLLPISDAPMLSCLRNCECEKHVNPEMLSVDGNSKPNATKIAPALFITAQRVPKKHGNKSKNSPLYKPVINNRTLVLNNTNSLSESVTQNHIQEELKAVCDKKSNIPNSNAKYCKVERKVKLRKTSPSLDQQAQNGSSQLTKDKAPTCIKGNFKHSKLARSDLIKGSVDKVNGNKLRSEYESDNLSCKSRDVIFISNTCTMPSSTHVAYPSDSSSHPNSNVIILNTPEASKTESAVVGNSSKDVIVKNTEQKNKVLSSRSSMLQKMKRRKGGREMNALYRNLKEISWAQDKKFTTLIKNFDSARHSNRLLAASSGMDRTNSKPLLKLREKKEDTNVNKKLPQKRFLPKPKPQSSITAIAKKKLNNSTKIARNTNFRCKPNINIVKSKALPKAIKMPNVSPKAKMKTAVDGKTIAKKKRPENQEACPVPSKRFKTKSSVLTSKSETKTESVIVSSTRKIMEGDLKVWKKFFQKKQFLSTMQTRDVQVTLEPLETTNLWPPDCNILDKVPEAAESFTRKSLQQRMLRVFTGIDQRHISSVLRDVPETLSANNGKNARKRKYDEESVRSSARQSECAFRYKEIVVKKHENYIQIVLVPSTSKQNSLSIEAMKELKDAFISARKDSNCKAVLFNSSGSFFCSGIDLTQLHGNNRKHAAEEMAITIRDLILTLALFPKPVIAAVNGYAVGLGVTILTFCDIVLSSDKAMFCIPSTRLGYIPEGGAMLTLPQVVGSTVAIEMLLQCRNLTAEQALKYGLVSEVIWPTRLMEEVVPRILSLVEQPLHVMEATKMMVRCHLWEKLAVQLDHEWRMLPTQWLSAVCQQNLKKQIRAKWQFD